MDESYSNTAAALRITHVDIWVLLFALGLFIAQFFMKLSEKKVKFCFYIFLIYFSLGYFYLLALNSIMLAVFFALIFIQAVYTTCVAFCLDWIEAVKHITLALYYLSKDNNKSSGMSEEPKEREEQKS